MRIVNSHDNIVLAYPCFDSLAVVYRSTCTISKAKVMADKFISNRDTLTISDYWRQASKTLLNNANDLLDKPFR